MSCTPSDGADHSTPALLPAHLEALGLLPVPRHHDRHICCGSLRLRGDGGELLLHPQHLAHANRRECGLPFAASRQARRQGDPTEAQAGLRLSAVCERTRGTGPGGPRHHNHQQHLYQLINSTFTTFYLRDTSLPSFTAEIHTRKSSHRTYKEEEEKKM